MLTFYKLWSWDASWPNNNTIWNLWKRYTSKNGATEFQSRFLACLCQSLWHPSTLGTTPKGSSWPRNYNMDPHHQANGATSDRRCRPISTWHPSRYPRLQLIDSSWTSERTSSRLSMTAPYRSERLRDFHIYNESHFSSNSWSHRLWLWPLRGCRQ